VGLQGLGNVHMTMRYNFSDLREKTGEMVHYHSCALSSDVLCGSCRVVLPHSPVNPGIVTVLRKLKTGTVITVARRGPAGEFAGVFDRVDCGFLRFVPDPSGITVLVDLSAIVGIRIPVSVTGHLLSSCECCCPHTKCTCNLQLCSGTRKQFCLPNCSVNPGYVQLFGNVRPGSNVSINVNSSVTFEGIFVLFACAVVELLSPDGLQREFVSACEITDVTLPGAS